MRDTDSRKGKRGRFVVEIWDDFQFDEDAAECGCFDTFEAAVAYARARVAVDRADSDLRQERRTPDGEELDTMTSYSIKETDGKFYESWEDPASRRYPTAEDFKILEDNGYPEFLLENVRAWVAKIDGSRLKEIPQMRLSEKFKAALHFALEAHQGQVRKRTSIPYFSHPMAVASLVFEFGGTEEQAIAALLHDTIEDCDVSQSDIAERFGATVASIVGECSDSQTQQKPPWEQRKKIYLEHLSKARPETLLVSACDKLHNARAIVRDVGEGGHKVWARFTATPGEIVWYYSSLHQIFKSRQDETVLPKALCSELEFLVSEMKALANGENKSS